MSAGQIFVAIVFFLKQSDTEVFFWKKKVTFATIAIIWTQLSEVHM